MISASPEDSSRILMVSKEWANLTVEPQQDDHHEKENRPELRHRHHGHGSRVSNERQARTCSDGKISKIEEKQSRNCFLCMQYSMQSTKYNKSQRLQKIPFLLTWRCYIWYVSVLLIRHETERREDGKASHKTGATIQKAQIQTVPKKKQKESHTSLIASIIFRHWVIYCIQICNRYNIKLTCNSYCCTYCNSRE